MRPAAVPTFAVDAVDTHKLNPTTFDVFAQHINHAPVFEFIKAALRRGEYQYGGPGMAEHKHIHVPIKRGTEPTMIASMHVMMLLAQQNAINGDVVVRRCPCLWRCRALL
jgi:hypothetical protein